MSLIADSLKKALKEKTFKVSPGINLLKNLGQKSKPQRFDPKEVKRFVLLIVVPAVILIFLLVANPFAPKNKVIIPQAPVIAQAPPQPTPVTPPTKQEVIKSPQAPPVVAKPAPVVQAKRAPVVAKKTSPPVAKKRAQKPVPRKTPEKFTMIEPGMKEVSVEELELAMKKPVARVELREPPDSPPARIKLAPKPPERQEKQPQISPKPREANPPAVEEQPLRTVEIPKTEKKENRVAALVPPQKDVTFPNLPEPDIFKNGDYYFNRAIFFQQSRDWEKALTNYAEAAKHSPGNPDIYNNMGVIHKELRQYNRAIEEFLRAVYLKPDYAKPYNNIGVVYFAKEDYLTAIQNYKKAISIDPKNLEALNNLSVAYKKMGQLEKAKSVLNQALKLGSNHAGTHYNLAVLHEEAGNMESAIHFYQKFTQLGLTSHPDLVRKVENHIKTLK